jgi:hypothetical protein
MLKTTKKRDSRSTSTIDLGKERKKRIKRFRSLQDPEGTRFSTIDDAVNTLIDKALELEQV